MKVTSHGYIFIGFYGWPAHAINQEKLVYKIGNDFECWNLKKCSLDEFILKIKKQIPPINNNVLNNYIANSESDFGINEDQFKDCCWGLLLPDQDKYTMGYYEIISLLNLYSTSFLRPAFYVSYMGVNVVNKKPSGNWLGTQNKSDLFKSLDFISFYKKMFPQAKYFRWFRDDVLLWNDEDWRLFMSASFYKDLEEYETSKSIYTWQRESADMATLLETLFTAGESEKEEIGYRLRKRMAVLIGWKFDTIESEIKNLYSDRSQFVHGSYYKRIAKEMKRNKSSDPAMPPSPDFKKLYQMKEFLRFSFVAYLYLHSKKTQKKVKSFNTFENVQKLLEEAIMDLKLREKIIKNVKPIIDLLPESKTGYIF